MCAGLGGGEGSGWGGAPKFQAVSGEAGCAGLESSPAHGWRPHLGSQALDTMGVDTWLRNTDSKEPQRRSISDVRLCGTPSKIRTEKTSPGSVTQSEKPDRFRLLPVTSRVNTGQRRKSHISSFPLGKRGLVPGFWALQRGQVQPLWFKVLVSWETKGPFNDPFQSVGRNPLRWERDGYQGPRRRDNSGQLKLSPWGLEGLDWDGCGASEEPQGPSLGRAGQGRSTATGP